VIHGLALHVVDRDPDGGFVTMERAAPVAPPWS
jgi:folate-dependent phosphoribosylglycinamide formyltransferase PurN